MTTLPSRKASFSPRPVGIKDIARALGVSTGTVDRALHDKPGINPMTRTRVLRMAESLGYRPNLAARHLKSRRTWHISVHLPREIALFWDSLREGIREAAAPFGSAVEVEFSSYPRLGEGDVELFGAALDAGTNGLIISPGDPAALKPWIRTAAQRGIPVVCVVTDAPDTQRLTSVSADPFTVGALAGDLLARFLPDDGPVAFFTGWLGTQDHADKLRGFQDSLKRGPNRVRLATIVEAHDDERQGYERATKLLATYPDIRGIYVSTVNSLPVLRAFDQAGRLEDVTVVTTDLFPKLVPWIRSGKVAATMYQRPVNQGRLALRALHQFLVEGTCPAPRITVVPHVVMRSNLEMMLERLPVDHGELAHAVPSAAARKTGPRRKPKTAHDRRRANADR